MPRGNPNPKNRLTRVYDTPVAATPVTVKLPVDLDEYVRSLPNKSEWLREAVAEKFARETREQKPA
jgi:hypothetical protein